MDDRRDRLSSLPPEERERRRADARFERWYAVVTMEPEPRTGDSGHPIEEFESRSDRGVRIDCRLSR